jgi:hypothetical protein
MHSIICKFDKNVSIYKDETDIGDKKITSLIMEIPISGNDNMGWNET